MGRRSGSRYVTVELSEDVCISDFEDDALIGEVIGRDLVRAVIAKSMGKDPDEKDGPQGPDEDVRDALHCLMAKRHAMAASLLRSAIEKMLPPELLAASLAIERGDYGEATSELDRYIDPTPAATAVSLPKEFARRAIQ